MYRLGYLSGTGENNGLSLGTVEAFALRLRPSKKNWLAPFFERFYGRKVFFDSEVLMQKYNKTHPYLFSLNMLHRSSFAIAK